MNPPLIPTLRVLFSELSSEKPRAGRAAAGNAGRAAVQEEVGYGTLQGQAEDLLFQRGPLRGGRGPELRPPSTPQVVFCLLGGMSAVDTQQRWSLFLLSPQHTLPPSLWGPPGLGTGLINSQQEEGSGQYVGWVSSDFQRWYSLCPGASSS